MRKLLLYCIPIIVFAGCGANPAYLKRGSLEKGKTVVIALLPFQNNSPDRALDPLGFTLADSIAAKMSVKTGFKVVERQKIEELLKEMKLGAGGAVDENTAASVGKLAGANVLAFGSFSVFDNKVLLVIKLVKVETGEIIGGAKGKSRNISDLDLLADEAAAKLAAAVSQIQL